MLEITQYFHMQLVLYTFDIVRHVSHFSIVRHACHNCVRYIFRSTFNISFYFQ